LWSPNRYEWVVTQYATSRMGAIMVNINPAYRSHELEHVLKQSGCSLLIMARAFRQTDYVAMFKEVEERLPAHIQALVIDDEWGALQDDAKGLRGRAGRARAHPGSRRPHRHPVHQRHHRLPQGRHPLAPQHPEQRLLRRPHAEVQREGSHLHPGAALPLLRPGHGQPGGHQPRRVHGLPRAKAFDPGAVLATVEKERCTSLYGVPTMFIAELEHANFQQDRLRQPAHRHHGWLALPHRGDEARAEGHAHAGDHHLLRHDRNLAGVHAKQVDDPLDKRVATVGCVHPNLEVKIVDPSSGHVVPRGTVGELCTRGYSVMLGYWDDLHSTRQAIDNARWMHTGDLATMDNDGYVNIVGRIKDMVMRGGENIYPREVEEFLYTKPEIADVQVIGVPDVKYGEELMAWIKLRPGASLTGDELRAFCKGKIATYKIPRYWKFVDAFPMTVTGKIQKYKMRETAVEELKLQTAASIKTA
jgi:fatty-acyl-CoA synthase